jgi:hypothetical protein
LLFSIRQERRKGEEKAGRRRCGEPPVFALSPLPGLEKMRNFPMACAMSPAAPS